MAMADLHAARKSIFGRVANLHAAWRSISRLVRTGTLAENRSSRLLPGCTRSENRGSRLLPDGTPLPIDFHACCRTEILSQSSFTPVAGSRRLPDSCFRPVAEHSRPRGMGFLPEDVCQSAGDS